MKSRLWCDHQGLRGSPWKWRWRALRLRFGRWCSLDLENGEAARRWQVDELHSEIAKLFQEVAVALHWM